MSPPIDLSQRQRLEALAAALRDAACQALARRWVLAQALDESRGEIERLLMLEAIDAAEARRVITRAEVMLDAWRGMTGTETGRHSR